MTYMQEAGVALAQHLYTPGALALDRKKAAATEVSAWQRPADMAPPRQRRTWTPLEDRILLEAATIDDAAAALGRTHRSCNLRRWRLLKKD
ncbi:hypothetical protein [Streptomyces sp. NPDC048623]|uniref:hypothetical protein n=1 Tax=Streptomyces sp. NPDC048623 TaxID=3155761 RepID=UPI0034186836